jgi:hypothetical protein
MKNENDPDLFGGWIKLHRKLLKNPIMQRPAYLGVWVFLLINANHEGSGYRAIMGDKMVTLDAGQLVTGRKKISKETYTPESTVEDILSFLEREQMIRQQKFNKYRLISILNWKKYQGVDNKATTKQQQGDTNQEHKNKRNNTAPDEPVRKASPEISKFNPLGAQIIKEFEIVNPACKRMYGNTTQRQACDDLIERYGLEKVLQVVRILPKSNVIPYMPSITTPAQLVGKWTQLESAFIKKKNERTSSVQSRITPDI